MMKDLVGRSFAIADGCYRIVDVRRLGGDTLVYAEPVPCAAERADAPAAGTLNSGAPARAAFHYGDIAELLAPSA
jgi:hypothetical protein